MIDRFDGGRRPALEPIRDEILTLADPDGAFVIRCASTGDRPVPVEDCRFPDREAAASAVELAEEYRRRLRAWDPRTPFCAPIVHEERAPAVGHLSCDERAAFAPSLVDRVRADDATPGEGD